MPVTVVVGGQFGSEGKGKVAHFLARERCVTTTLRVGGPNSGHTVIDPSGKTLVFRLLPTAAILDDVICVVVAGSYVDVDILLREIENVQLPTERLWIDPNAFIVSDAHKRQEHEWELGDRIGSTQSGTGAAVIDRVKRYSSVNLAQNDYRLTKYVKPVRSLLRSKLNCGEHILIEGTQGFGLSLLHAKDYPKATSRDTTAASFVAEAGLSPLDVTEIILVIRAFPIRVAGDSGPLPNEIDWETISREGGWNEPLCEYTSVTQRVRRVARFDPSVVRAAIETNAPTTIALNHADYVDASCVTTGNLTSKISLFVSDLEGQIQRHIDYIGLGPASLVPRPIGSRLSAYA